MQLWVLEVILKDFNNLLAGEAGQVTHFVYRVFDLSSALKIASAKICHRMSASLYRFHWFDPLVGGVGKAFSPVSYAKSIIACPPSCQINAIKAADERTIDNPSSAYPLFLEWYKANWINLLIAMANWILAESGLEHTIHI